MNHLYKNPKFLQFDANFSIHKYQKHTLIIALQFNYSINVFFYEFKISLSIK